VILISYISNGVIMNSTARLILLGLSAALLLAACGETPATEENTDLVTADSTTVVEPVTDVVVEDTVTAAPEVAVLFDFYTVPVDWPRMVPLMTEFQVTEYSCDAQGMHAAGFGNTEMSWANNYYTNARQEFVSSNIWAFDPANTSITEGDQQVFYYTGEGHFLVINLNQVAPGRVEFTLDYTE
jgi:hypothetical protein